MMKYFEPHFEERVELARKRAKRVHDGQFDVAEGEEDILAILRWIICRHYGMPYFSDYFEHRTFDDMVFEVELIQLMKRQGKTNVEQGSELLKEASKKESEALFDDWVTEDQAALESNFAADAAKFMQTGEFKGEK